MLGLATKSVVARVVVGLALAPLIACSADLSITPSAPTPTASPIPSPAPTQGITYFEWNSRNGYRYLGPQNAHPGGGYFSWLGGDPAKPEGTGCDNPGSFHNTVLSSDAAAANAWIGSSAALKTPYKGTCPNEGFTRDTTIIRTPLLSEYYVRWHQKWTGSFQASVQQKFAKFYNSADTQSTTITGHLSMRPNNHGGATPGATTGLFENYMPNIEGHFNKGACTLYTGIIWISPTPIAFTDCYDGQTRGEDDSDLTAAPISLSLNQWYLIEVHSKLNSGPGNSDAIYEVWIDGVLRLAAYNFKFIDGLTYNSPGTNVFEFQHVYYDRSDQDQATYMDDIVISDYYNGPVSPP